MELPIISEDDDTDIVSFEVQGHTSDARPELDHFSGLDLVESDHSGDTITNTDNSSEFLDIVHLGNVHDFVLNHLGGVSDAQLL